MSDFSFLCGSDYGHPSHGMDLASLTVPSTAASGPMNFSGLITSSTPSPMELVSLLVFARNGDRSPEKGRNKGWRKNMCVKCSKGTCQLTQCGNGMLTVKGYKQGHDLAGFIKKEYYPRFNKKISYGKSQGHPLPREESESMADISVHGYYYKSKKNHVFIKSIVGALDYSNVRLKPIEDLGCPSECLDLRNALFSKNDSEKLISGGEFDRIVGSLCNEIPVECGKFSCDLADMEEYLTQEKMNFEDNLVKMAEDIVPTAVSFGGVSEFILGVLPNREISIVSVTAETIITLLAGLNTDNSRLVPYAGAVFIELWRTSEGKELYSVVYNGKRENVGLFKEKFVEKREFEKFLKMFVKHRRDVNEICRFKPKVESIDELMAVKDEILELKKERVRGVFSPLIRKLHEKRVLVK